MTGPEHYREAERLLEAADRSFKAGWPDNAAAQVALAHEHATLALVAIAAIAAGEWWE
jgi:HEPN domain-containing protein